MSTHEGVTCSSCFKRNFRGQRYKCLNCYNVDLCSECFEAGTSYNIHPASHALQCILSRSYYQLYYGGEPSTSLRQPKAYTCPLCSRMGFTVISLQEHATVDHAGNNSNVICPVCISTDLGPSQMVYDFPGHLNSQHNTGLRDLVSFVDEQVATHVHDLRHIQYSEQLGVRSRAYQSGRPWRSTMHFSFTGQSASSRDSAVPVAELLSQLSQLPGFVSNASNGTFNLLQQLRRQHVSDFMTETTSSADPTSSRTLMLKSFGISAPTSSISSSTSIFSDNFLLKELLEQFSLKKGTEHVRLEHCQYLHELVLSSMSKRNESKEAEHNNK